MAISEIRGVYLHDGFTANPPTLAPFYWDFGEWERLLRWLKACGINTVEFATMLEFTRIPSTELERRKTADRQRLIASAHNCGMCFSHILTTTAVSTVPAGENPSHQLNDRARVLCPREPGNFERTMEIQSYFMEAMREADFFEVFAADWGGCGCGRCGTEDYLRYVIELARRAAALNPRAVVFANTWAIAQWGSAIPAGDWRLFWDRETAQSREVIGALPSLPPNVHPALPCHHLYRPLVFESYGGKTATPPFPSAADMGGARAASRDVLAWPHFLMDDDVYRPEAWGIAHCEARYLALLAGDLRALGIRNVMGNLYLPSLQIVNTWVFGRLLADASRDPMDLLHEFSAHIACPGDIDALADVLAWMDNNSWWNSQTPQNSRPAALPTRATRAMARRQADAVRPRRELSIPLPIDPAQWLDHLRHSIARMNWAP
ncbi:MAG: hypothetical protein WCK47_11925 [bacterium]|nr:hypothetical protein [Candidatus Sumerlaeota bacterium]